MLISQDSVGALLALPGGAELSPDPSGGPGHKTLNGKPVMIDFERSVVDREWLMSSAGSSAVERRRAGGLGRRLLVWANSSRRVSERNAGSFRAALKKRREHPLVLVAGGGSVGAGLEGLYEDPEIDLVAFDVYDSPNVQLLADAHDLPFRDTTFDGVVIQAVLEHVLDPRRCVEEIHRVLKPGGLVYAETPFLQHVHEGAYDFTRFTESGHRYLFRSFAEVDAGAVGGPGTQLQWAIEYAVRSVTRSVKLGKVAKVAFFWLPLLDRMIPEPYAVDAASGVYFMGSKADREITPKDAVTRYRGAQ